jgi:chloramphenicol-sensitive protein RarD
MRDFMRGHSSTPDPVAAAPAHPHAGLGAAVAAFVIWGFLPLYLLPLSNIPATQILSHRVVWCCLLTCALLAVRGELHDVLDVLSNRASLLRLAGSAACISVNWLLYTWTVTHGHVVEASLGYFINPLLSVVLGVVVLGEQLNPVQKTAIGIATAGVGFLAVVAGRPPWIALTLAASFAIYGMIRKVVVVGSIVGLTTETLLLAPLAVAYLVTVEMQGTGALGHSSALVNVLLLASGLVTAVPLVLFAYGARRIPLSTVGLTQYIAPTLQFLTGILVFREPFTAARAAGFAIIWSAIALYAVDGLVRSRRIKSYA